MCLIQSPPSSSSTPSLPFPRVRFSPGIATKRSRRSPALRLHSLRANWKPTDIDPDAAQERLSSWFLKACTLLAEAAAPFLKPTQGKRPGLARDFESTAFQEEVFVASELTVERKTPNGCLSFAAVISIEQFGRLNGLTGRKMQKIFKALAPEHLLNDARSLVEYCCFRYLSRNSSDLHPSLKGRLVREEAFVRIAPAVAGIADISTAHHLFKVLVGDEEGISINLWTAYLTELCKVHQGRDTYEPGDILLSDQQFLCIDSSRKRLVLKWENNIAWPGNLTLTDKALYFEAIMKLTVGFSAGQKCGC